MWRDQQKLMALLVVATCILILVAGGLLLNRVYHATKHSNSGDAIHSY